MKLLIGTLRLQQESDRLNDVVGVLRNVNPRESNHPPAVEHCPPVSFTVPSECVCQLVPSPRVPLKSQALIRKSDVESPIRLPRDWILESGLRQPAVAENVGTPPLKGRAVGWTGPPVFKDGPDLANPRLPASTDPVHHLGDFVDVDSLVGDDGLEDGGKVATRQLWRQVNDCACDRGHRQALDIDDVVVNEIVATPHCHTGKVVGRAGVDQHTGHAAPKLGHVMQFGGRVVRHHGVRKGGYSRPHAAHGSGQLDDLVAESAE